ncbi:hypothetical protein EDC30_112106 [Paucimonas lemoignei]|uniref:TM2 domain-containing protein n=1 Tax=Paucimonas lemoignei TaxID=29443 RepID=A0A4R3HQZ9_PAULE|nr:hypothetical protein [Paucimonas lemoignei]TCS34773.1 hypothetical protein EDC30_112106 [Paucimonas lemoignei]
MLTMAHKHKTFATLLAGLVGASGAHRFYLYGKRDFWAWTYVGLLLLYLCLALSAYLELSPISSILVVFPIPAYVGLIEALALGLTADEKWDQIHNPQSGLRTRSTWRLAVVLVLTLFFGFIALVAGLARATDLYLTGGSFG